MACATNTWCVSPSQYWEGNDGPWSTFTVRVGTPPKPVHLLPATSQSTIWTVMPFGCTAYSDAPANCSTIRGQTFDPAKSSTFDYDGYQDLYDKSIYFQLPFETEAPLSTSTTNYSGNALVGSDAITLGSEGNDSPPLKNQTVAAYAGLIPFIGQLGLKSQDATILNLTDTRASVLGFMNATGAVASATYGYTAGSKGRNILGSLTFGGYDAARGNVEDVITQQMSAPSTRDLQVAVSGLSIGSTPVSSFPSTATFVIDSMIPEIYLPGSVCDQIQSAFGLNYSSTWGVYYLNDAQHQNLTNMDQSSTSLTFTLQALGTNPGTTRITIPYIDLDHQLSWPVAGIQSGTQRYFPIKRANTSDQYFLGRTFLQDAYIGVDYDNQRFNVSPALFPTPNTLTDIVQIYNHASSGHHSSGLGAGAIAGIAVGSAAAVALIAGLVFFYYRKRRNDRLRFSMATTMRPSMDGTTINNDNRPDMGYYKPPQDVKHQTTYDHYNKGPIEMNGEDQDQFKPELQGSYAHREMSSSRHELYGSSVRRTSDQSRASISPLGREESQRGRFRHLRQESDSSFGWPSPASLTNSPPFGPNDISGHPSPPVENLATFAGPFELFAGSRTGPREVTSAPAVPDSDAPAVEQAVVTQPANATELANAPEPNAHHGAGQQTTVTEDIVPRNEQKSL